MTKYYTKRSNKKITKGAVLFVWLFYGLLFAALIEDKGHPILAWGFMFMVAAIPVWFWVNRQLRKTKAHYRLLSSGIHDIDKMKGTEFEYFLGELFKKKGIKSTVTSKTGDFGCDVLIEKDGKRISIQAKCYGEGEKVGVSAIQEVYTSLNYWNAQEAWCITNRDYTEAARQLANVNNVYLINREGLVDLLAVDKEVKIGDILIGKHLNVSLKELAQLFLSRQTFKWDSENKQNIRLFWKGIRKKHKIIFSLILIWLFLTLPSLYN